MGALLSPFCDIRIGGPVFGKHDQISEVAERYDWVFNRIPLDDFKIFLLFRDPLERALSLYKSHSHPVFLEGDTSTSGMSMSDFISSWLTENTWMSLPQFLHALYRDRGFVADFLIRTDRLSDDLPAALALVDATVDINELPQYNVSPPIAGEAQLRNELQQKLGDRYKIDQYLYKRFGGRQLNSEEKGAISTYIAGLCEGEINRDTVQRSIHIGFETQPKSKSIRTRKKGSKFG